MKSESWLYNLTTPFLLIDEKKVSENIERLKERLRGKNVILRPHLKTLRSKEFTQKILPSRNAPATVSTLAEAEALAQEGYTDLLYAVGISPDKLSRVAKIRELGTNLHILIDSIEQAIAVDNYSTMNKVLFSVFIEIDCDGHRGGLLPDSDQLYPIAKKIEENGSTLTGLMTHAGESYHCLSAEEIKISSRVECESVIKAAKELRLKGIECPILSVGSTPTAHFSDDLKGITEVRAGVFSTFDLFMSNVGVCKIENIALSVVTTVIGYNKEKNWLFIDAGWMAMSKDRGTANQAIDYKYGLVCNLSGQSLDVYIDNTSQEHGIIHIPKDSALQLSDFPIGFRLRILPNHACATAAMHQIYEVINSTDNIHSQWKRITGW